MLSSYGIDLILSYKKTQDTIKNINFSKKKKIKKICNQGSQKDSEGERLDYLSMNDV